MCGFTDADWEGSPSDQKSTSGGISSVGSTTISWYSKKKIYVAISSAKAEYMATSQATYEEIWMRKILLGFFGQMMDPNVIYCDNNICFKLSKNLVFHDQPKHIGI